MSFGDRQLEQECGLSKDYTPKPPSHFLVDRIVFAKGSLDTPERQTFVNRICALYPDAEKIEMLDAPHNRIKLTPNDPLGRHKAGKHTLVFGVMGTSVRFSQEQGNTCPNYWHFSTTGFCFYDCKYCYLAGTPGVWFSPTVKIYVNIEDILARIDRQANKFRQQIPFYLGKLQDGLALDPLTAYRNRWTTRWMPHSLHFAILESSLKSKLSLRTYFTNKKC